MNVSQIHYDEWRCLCAHFQGEHRHTQHQMLWRNSWFQRVLTSSLIRSRSRKLELGIPKGVGSNCKHRLMTPPEGRFSYSKSFLSTNLHTSLPSIWHSDSRMGSYGCDITSNLWHHHCPSVISHRFATAADKIWCLLAGMTSLFMSWLEEGLSHFLQVSGSPPFLWGTLKIDFCSTTNHKTSTYAKVNVDP